MSNKNFHHNSETKIKFKKMTQCTALRGKVEAAISPGMHFPKYGKKNFKKRKKASQQSMSKDQRDSVPFRQGPLPGP